MGSSIGFCMGGRGVEDGVVRLRIIGRYTSSIAVVCSLGYMDQMLSCFVTSS